MSFARTAAIVLSCALAIGGGGCESSAPAQGAAPAFQGQTASGEAFDLASLRGQVVLLNVWATWCEPCRKELPELQRLHEQHGESGFVVVGASVDKPDLLYRVKDLQAEFGLTYPIVLDPEGKLSAALNVTGYPTSVLIDREGIIRFRRVGVIAPRDRELMIALSQTLAPLPSDSPK